MEKEIKKNRKKIDLSEELNPDYYTLEDFIEQFNRVAKKLRIPVGDLVFKIDDDDERYAEFSIQGTREQTEEEEKKEALRIEEFEKLQEQSAYNRYLELKKKFEKPTIEETI